MSASSERPPRLTRRGTPPKAGMVHLGPGAFFRAFSAAYTDDVMKTRGGDWGIIAVSLKSTAARDALVPQGGCYTSVSLSAGQREAHVVGSVTEVLVAPEDPAAVVTRLADPDIRIVTLTVTEKGYCHVPSTGRLQSELPDILHDLSHPEAPRTVPGLLVAALAVRRAAGHRPFTVLSCDNLPENGKTARAVVLEFARLYDPDLMGWIASEVRFPSTMVDRITPATTAEDIDLLARQTGYFDLAAVHHEPFRQWVIEDDFVDGVRPDWAVAGAQFVQDVTAHEMMKLRCLNGTHSALAYLGYLAGYETIADTVGNADFAAFCKYLWHHEILPTVSPPEGQELVAYTNDLMERYRNPAIRHRTWQIAMDGSQKLPQRILGTIRDRLVQGSFPEGLCLVVAAWMRYVGGLDEQGNAIDVRDPLANRLKELSAAAETNAERVAALLALSEIFETDLSGHEEFRKGVTVAYENLASRGAQKSVHAFLNRAKT